MGIYEKRRSISRPALKRYLKREAPRRLPGTRIRITPSKRMKIEKEVFGKKYGHHITRQEFQKKIRHLEKEKHRTHTPTEMRDLRRRITYLKEIGGI